MIRDFKKLKILREKTGLSIQECQKALEKANGELDRALLILKSRVSELAQDKTQRETKAGTIEVYLHPTKQIGAMVQLHCETDFVAKSLEFQKLAHELCLQVAAMNPLYIEPKRVPEEAVFKEKELWRKSLIASQTPQKLIDQILRDKVQKYKEEISLLSQSWIRNQKLKVGDLIQEFSARSGEKIQVKNFVRFAI